MLVWQVKNWTVAKGMIYHVEQPFSRYSIELFDWIGKKQDWQGNWTAFSSSRNDKHYVTHCFSDPVDAVFFKLYLL